MVFSSNIFLFAILPAFLGVYYLVLAFSKGTSTHAANFILLILSLAFYYLSTGPQGSLLVGSIFLNWFVSGRLNRSKSRKAWLTVGIIANLAVLVWYKYACFIVHAISSNTSCNQSELPVGISFFTFMAISYLIEVNRKAVPTASLLSFGTYLSLFPHLVAGPIVRYSELYQELIKKRAHSVDIFFSGIQQFAFGFAKKVLIADNVSAVSDMVFGLPMDRLDTEAVWLGALCYTIQIFFDFSGYTDMAIGLAKMFGFHFPRNFDQPYRSTSITEFWRRWHMTLSRWFRDYLYIPLGGNQHGQLRTYFNLIVVFLLVGLWHGAAWTFIAWGAYHGSILIIERVAINRFGYQPSGLAAWLLSFLLIVVGWVLFRSPSISYAAGFLHSMFFPTAATHSYGLKDVDQSTLFFLLMGFGISVASPDWFTPIKKTIGESSGLLLSGSVAVMLLLGSTAYLATTSFKPFIYFRF